MKRKKSNVVISPEMQKRIHRMALRTWDQIGSDMLTAIQEQGEPAFMKKAEVLEVVSDAGYMETYGGDKEAYKVWDSLPSYEEKLKAIDEAFTYRTYGW